MQAFMLQNRQKRKHLFSSYDTEIGRETIWRGNISNKEIKEERQYVIGKIAEQKIDGQTAGVSKCDPNQSLH